MSNSICGSNLWVQISFDSFKTGIFVLLTESKLKKNQGSRPGLQRFPEFHILLPVHTSNLGALLPLVVLHARLVLHGEEKARQSTQTLLVDVLEASCQHLADYHRARKYYSERGVSSQGE
jgi:hypothetical protein